MFKKTARDTKRRADMQEFVKQGNTLEVPIDMITDGAPPDSTGTIIIYVSAK